jgi:hypothetical protein
LSEAESAPDRARIVDLLRPQRLYVGILVRPNFVFPTLVFVASLVLYTQLAVGPALPRVIPELLERSFATQSELIRTFRYFVLIVSVALPIVVVVVTALLSWMILQLVRARIPFPNVLSLTAYSALWIAVGFLLKAVLVQVTGEAEPATNLSFFVEPSGRLGRTLLALTNPFALLALVWSVKGLRAWGASGIAAGAGGAIPWIAWIVLVAETASGPANRFAPTGPVSYANWGTIERGSITVRHPAGYEKGATDLADALDAFASQVAAQLDFEPRPLKVFAHPDHATLERATGEFLHVRVPGSIRGTNLLYVEIPGNSAALTPEEGLREAMRYAGVMQVAPILSGAPRWFVHGTVHATIYPYSRELERRYRTIVRRQLPTYEDLFDPQLFRTPQGPILARSLVDFIAYHHGPETPAAIQADLKNGIPFRDSLYARTRLTTSALEIGWQESIRAFLGENTPDSALDRS